MKSWLLANGRRRCARCRHDWRPERMPLRLTTTQWRSVLRWFVRGMSSAQIARETRFDRKRILRALLVLRRQMCARVPAALAHCVQDEDSTGARGGASQGAADPTPKRAGTPVLAIYASHGQFWGQLVSDDEAMRIAQTLRERGPEGLDVSGLGPFNAVVYRRRLYRLSEPGEDRSSAQFGQVEAFWSYLQRQLRSKGGIRRSRLNLYLAEYAWRYNHRKLSHRDQLNELMELVREARPGVRNGAFPQHSSSSFRHASP